MSGKSYPMTKQGLISLQLQLEELQTVEKHRVKERIKHARTFCDFLEDSEYDAALKEQMIIEAKIKELKEKIQNVQLIERQSYNTIELGSRVTIHDLEENVLDSYNIVGVEESNPEEGKISYKSPLGEQLLGHKLDDIVMINVPNGKREIKIISID